MSAQKTLLACCLLGLLLAGCAAKVPPLPPDPVDVADLSALPQSVWAYVPRGQENRPLLDPVTLEGLRARFLAARYAPWDRAAPPDKAGDLFWGLDYFAHKPFYGENTLRLGPQWLEGMRRLARPGDFPNFGRAAIAVANTSLRVLPSAEPAFLNRFLPGEGYPFDMLQNTGIWAGTPLYLTHLSADGAWALAIAPYASGWVPLADVAFADEGLRKEFRSLPLLAVTRDRVPLADGSGLFRFQGRVGMFLPLVSAGPKGYTILLPARDAQGRAVALRGIIAPADAAPLPLPATAGNLAHLAQSMMGEPYGWGGLYGLRDCSALLQDLFAPFGVGLPRNSRQQAKAGEYLSLEGLSDAAKEALILKRGEPLATLLWKPGHILLYLGPHDGRAMVLHDVWGLRTREGGREGRHVIGRVAVTTLTPGAELNDLVRPDGLLVHSLKGMVLLAPAAPAGCPAPDSGTP